ncbi:MAG TPA: hypothetical protein DEO62_00805 [Lachnospiraceae bacterium]|nr:hypothetical protein [Lachnospiraceae bacterium]HBZ89547.1 hypothetical protein [Lachnospiraceae bacterium]
MTGLEKILSGIKEESEAKAKEILDEAASEAAKFAEDTAKEAEGKVSEIKKQGQAKAADIKKRGDSAADLIKRKTLLSAKQEIISSIFDEAYDKLLKLDGAAYNDFCIKVAVKNAQDKAGAIIFNKDGKTKLSSDFESKVNAALKAAGKNNAKLCISDEVRDIKGGFILSYDGIEENCTFEALIDSAKETKIDAVAKILFN